MSSSQFIWSTSRHNFSYEHQWQWTKCQWSSSRGPSQFNHRGSRYRQPMGPECGKGSYIFVFCISILHNVYSCYKLQCAFHTVQNTQVPVKCPDVPNESDEDDEYQLQTSLIAVCNSSDTEMVHLFLDNGNCLRVSKEMFEPTLPVPLLIKQHGHWTVSN